MSRRRRIQRVGVVAKVGSREAAEMAQELGQWLRRRGLEVALDEATIRSLGLDGLLRFSQTRSGRTS